MPGLPSSPLDDFHFSTERVILKSSDGIEFKVYKNILALASPFFKTMFSETGPEDGETTKTITTNSEGVQVIELTELGSILDYLLRLVYPIPPPRFPGLSESGEVEDAEELMKALDPVLSAALKYDIQLVSEKLCAQLLDAAEAKRPDGRVIHETLAVRVYAVACQYGLKDVARRAAHASLKGRVFGVFFDNFYKISAAQYFALVNFHGQIVKRLKDVVDIDGGVAYRHMKCTRCGRTALYTKDVAIWWLNWCERANPILRESPLSDEVFSEGFLTDVYTKAKQCNSAQCEQIVSKWVAISTRIRERILEEIERVRCVVRF